jgi:hypothetical protein
MVDSVLREYYRKALGSLHLFGLAMAFLMFRDGLAISNVITPADSLFGLVFVLI